MARKKGKGPGRSYARLTRAERNSIADAGQGRVVQGDGPGAREVALDGARRGGEAPVRDVAQVDGGGGPAAATGARSAGVRVRPQARRHQGACRRWPASPARTLRARRSRGRPDESGKGSRGPAQACLPKSSERHPATPPTGKTPKRKRLCGPRFVRLGAGTSIQPRVFG